MFATTLTTTTTTLTILTQARSETEDACDYHTTDSWQAAAPYVVESIYTTDDDGFDISSLSSVEASVDGRVHAIFAGTSDGRVVKVLSSLTFRGTHAPTRARMREPTVVKSVKR